jgi:hypothetical protein
MRCHEPTGRSPAPLAFPKGSDSVSFPSDWNGLVIRVILPVSQRRGKGVRTEDIDALAASLDIHIARHRARAGERTRFRFFVRPADYFSGDGLGTVVGPRNALMWLSGFQAARTLDREGTEAS